MSRPGWPRGKRRGPLSDKHRRAISGERNGSARLTRAAIRDILRREHSSYVYAEMYGVSDSTIRHVWTRRTWSQIERAKPRARRK